MKRCSSSLAIREMQIKYTIKRVRRQIAHQEKIFAKDTPVRGLLSKICKELCNLNNKKISQF